MRTWGAQPTVFRYGDDAEQHYIDIASCLDQSIHGCTAVGTVGLSDHDLGLGPVRVELIGAFPTAFEAAPNIAATCAFNAFKDGVPTRPDAIHPNVLRLYAASTVLPHILLTDPFLWEDGPRTLGEASFQIAWLMMIPISDNERLLADREGVDKLTALLEQKQIDILDLNRPSAV